MQSNTDNLEIPYTDHEKNNLLYIGYSEDIAAIYLSQFNKLPSTIFDSLDAKIEVVVQDFDKEFANIHGEYQILYNKNKLSRNTSTRVYISHSRESLIEFTGYGEDQTQVRIYYDYSEFVEPWMTDIKVFLLKRVNRSDDLRYIHFIMPSNYGGLDLTSTKFTTYNVDVNKNYNEDFMKVHNEISEYLTKSISGVHILQGIPGSGKSSYIKHLITSFKSKKFIYCPSNMVGQLASPDFLKLLIREGQNSVLIIEDAEEALANDGVRSSAVSNILNISDGLLGESLKIQVIATFNTETKNIDEAMLRKGRLLTSYKFGKLGIDKTRSLLNDLGIDDSLVTDELTLADIYNYEKSEYFIKHKTKIGL